MREMHNDDVMTGAGLVRAREMIVQKLFTVMAFLIMFGSTASAEQMEVLRSQMLMHRFMVARSDSGSDLARAEFTQVVQGDEVTMHLTYRFSNGSLDDEVTTYRQHGTFQLVRDRHVQEGPFFSKPVDFTVEGTTGTAITRTTDKNGKVVTTSEHIKLPQDLSNGFIGTLLLNLPRNVRPFRLSLLVPVNGGRLIHIQISPEEQRPFRMGGRDLKATVFRVHPDLGRVVGLFARLMGIQPKDVMVWVLEGDEPAVVRIVGQLGGSGPIISSELEDASF